MQIRTAILLLMTLAWLGNACDESADFDASKIPLGTPQSGTITDGTPSVGTPTGPDGGDGPPPPPPPPPAQDVDQDGISDATDNCPQHANANQLSTIAKATNGDRCNTDIVWVSASGDDTHDGFYDTPVKTVQKGIALSEAKSGPHFVFVMAGTYEETVIISKNLHLYGGFAETDNQLVRDPQKYESLIRHNSNGALLAAYVILLNATSQAVLDGLHLQRTSDIAAMGILIASPHATVRDVTITLNGTFEATGIMIMHQLPVSQFTSIDRCTMYINEGFVAAKNQAFAQGVNWYDFTNVSLPDHIAISNSSITIGYAKIAVGIALSEQIAESDAVLEGNHISLTHASQLAIGMLLGWNKYSTGPSALLPYDTRFGKTARIDHTTMTIAPAIQQFGIFARGTEDLHIANNALSLTNTAQMLIPKPHVSWGLYLYEVDTAAAVLNTLRIKGPNSARGIFLNTLKHGIVVNNLMELSSMAAATALGINDVQEISLMAGNLIFSPKPMTYYVQMNTPAMPINTASTPDALEALVQTQPNLTPISTFLAVDNPSADPQFMDTESVYQLKSTSPARDSGVDLAGKLPEAEMTLILHDIAGTSRPKGKGWDIGAFEQ